MLRTHYYYVHVNMQCHKFTKNQKVRLCGRGDLTSLFKSYEILEVRGDLSINVEDKKSL